MDIICIFLCVYQEIFWHVCPHCLKKPEELSPTVLISFAIHWTLFEFIMSLCRWHFALSYLLMVIRVMKTQTWRLLNFSNPSICVTRWPGPCFLWVSMMLFARPLVAWFHMDLWKRHFYLVVMFCHLKMLKSLSKTKKKCFSKDTLLTAVARSVVQFLILVPFLWHWLLQVFMLLVPHTSNGW